jgi:ribose-phosphate pyrophosphokinase
MISINRNKVDIKHFPDNTLLMKFAIQSSKLQIQWFYESDEEIFALICTVKHLRRINSDLDLSLYMPYCPHARMDRVKEITDVFTLKYFADVINSLNFSKITVVDPHSSVSVSLIDKIEIKQPTEYIRSAIDEINKHTGQLPILCFPDEGSMKRYYGLFSIPYVFCIKERDWKTGTINNLLLVGETERIKNRNVLIIDDICSKGGTFLYTARELQKYKPISISLFITHCENSVLNGELINSELLNKIYTTNSIFTKQHELIKVIEL